MIRVQVNDSLDDTDEWAVGLDMPVDDLLAAGVIPMEVNPLLKPTLGNELMWLQIQKDASLFAGYEVTLESLPLSHWIVNHRSLPYSPVTLIKYDYLSIERQARDLGQQIIQVIHSNANRNALKKHSYPDRSQLANRLQQGIHPSNRQQAYSDATRLEEVEELLVSHPNSEGYSKYTQLCQAVGTPVLPEHVHQQLMPFLTSSQVIVQLQVLSRAGSLAEDYRRGATLLQTYVPNLVTHYQGSDLLLTVLSLVREFLAPLFHLAPALYHRVLQLLMA